MQNCWKLGGFTRLRPGFWSTLACVDISVLLAAEQGQPLATVLAALIALCGTVVGLAIGFITAEINRRQKADELFFRALDFLAGGSQKRNLGIAAIELYWRRKRHRDLCASLLAGSAVYLLQESKQGNAAQGDAAHEKLNLERIMAMITDLDAPKLRQVPYDALLKALDDKLGGQDKGLSVSECQLRDWKSKLQGSVPSTAWREVVAPGEEELFQVFAHEIEEQQKEFSRREAEFQEGGLRHGTVTLRRGFHAKLHAGLMAEFQVLDGLPQHARFGIFNKPRVIPAVIRFSNGEAGRNPDNHKEPRGIAIKLIGVMGPKVAEHADALTQDFLATSHSVTSTVRDARQFIAVIRALRNRRTWPIDLARRVGIRESSRILVALIRTVFLSKVASMATESYAGTAPIKCGPYAVKFTVRPVEGTDQTTGPQASGADFLREDLKARLLGGDLAFDFLLQFYVNEKRTPIEDTSVSWKPDDAPFVNVARLRIPSCRLDDPDVNRVSEAIDQLAFSPWHALEDHRPLGSVMRARRLAYPASSNLRGGRPEPISLPL